MVVADSPLRGTPLVVRMAIGGALLDLMLEGVGFIRTESGFRY